MKRDRNEKVSRRLDTWTLPKDVRDILNNTDLRVTADLFGDISQPETLVSYIRSNWDIDADKYTWEELTNWKY